MVAFVYFRAVFNDNLVGPLLSHFSIKVGKTYDDLVVMTTEDGGYLILDYPPMTTLLLITSGFKGAGFNIGSSTWSSYSYFHNPQVDGQSIFINVYPSNQLPTVASLCCALGVDSFDTSIPTYNMIGPCYNHVTNSNECPPCNELEFRLPITVAAEILSYNSGTTMGNGITLTVSNNDGETVYATTNVIDDADVITQYLRYNEGNYQITTSGYSKSQATHYAKLILGDGTVKQQGVFSEANFPKLTGLTYAQVNGAYLRLSRSPVTIDDACPTESPELPEGNPGGDISTTALLEQTIGDI